MLKMIDEPVIYIVTALYQALIVFVSERYLASCTFLAYVEFPIY